MIVDNVFATPVLQQPLELGADLVVYSATKHIDGQGRCLGGAILSDRTLHADVLQPYLKHTGPALSPFNAWVLLKGLETLDSARAPSMPEMPWRSPDSSRSMRARREVLYPGLLGSPPARAVAPADERSRRHGWRCAPAAARRARSPCSTASS